VNKNTRMFSLNNAERELRENESEIFSLLMTSENLEKLYIRDVVDPDEYLDLE
jgi:hypothetical protein